MVSSRARVPSIAILLLASAALAGGATNRLGYPLLTSFDQQQHHGGSQTFAMAQDSRGLLYFANLRGVLTYDGAWWSLVTLPRNAPALSIGIDGAGHIGVGTVDNFGTLAPDPAGALKFQSLMSLLPANLQGDALGEFEIATPDGDTMLFVTTKLVLRWDGKSVKLLFDDRDKASIRRVQVENGHIFVALRDGLVELGGPRRFEGKRVDLLLGDLAIVRNEGLFTLAGVPVSSPASTWLKGKVVMDGCRLRDGRRAITTVKDGIVILDAANNIEQIIGREAGLPDSLTYGAREDSEGSLWIVHDLGMVRVDLASPVDIVDERSGLKGSVHDVIRHQGKLFASSSHGLYVLDDRAKTISTIDGITGSPWCALSLGDELLVGASSGVYSIQGTGKPQRIPGTEQLIIYALAAAPGDRSHIYLGCPDGLGSLRHSGGVWHFEGFVPGGKPYVREFVEFDGELWCGSTYDGGMHIDPKGVIHSFGSGNLTPLLVGERMVITTDEGDGHFLQLRRDGHLVPDPVLGDVRAPDRWDAAMADGAGNLWLNTSPPSMLRRQAGGAYEHEARTRVALPAGDVEVLQPDRDGAMWIGGDHGLYHVMPLEARRALAPPQPVIRRIVSGNDHVLFGGFGPLGGPKQSNSLPYSFRRLRIEVGPASFRPGMRYQYRLAPIEEHWSVWRDEPLIEYTNLAEGSYTFNVRTRGAAGQAGPETTWAFTVLPPWYRTPWALILWLLLGAAIIGILISLRTRSLRVQAETLRARVAEQTVALREANIQLAKLAVSDDLTGIPNRREFERALAAEWERAVRYQSALALILLDLDYFKMLNDNHGHQAGDECLRKIGALLAEMIRGSGDVLARYGGEEFALLLPSTEAPGAAIVAERMRQIIEQMAVESGSPHGVITASFGVASIVPTREIEPSMLVAHADRALYVAKRSGRSCVRIDDATSKESWLREAVIE
jgi:diguanylate cyclase (GGDEF)-like protein